MPEFRSQGLPSFRGAQTPMYGQFDPLTVPNAAPNMTPAVVPAMQEPQFATPVAAPVAPTMPMQMDIKGPTSTTESQATVYREADLAAWKKAQDEQQSAIQRQAEIEAKLAQQAAEAQAAVQAQYQASYDKSAQLIAQKQSQYDSTAKEYDNAVKKYTEAKLVDPKAEQNIFQRVGAAIAVGLGAYASSITKTPNYALQIVNDAIERNVQRQKFEIEKLGVDVAAKRNDLARLQSEIGNADLAERAFRQAILEKTKLQVENFAAASKSDLVKARAAQMIAGIDEEKAKIGMEANKIVARNVEQAAVSTYATVSTSKTNPLQTPLGTAYSETAANKVREIYAAAEEGKAGVTRFKNTLKELGLSRFAPGEKSGKMQAATDTMKNTLRELNNMGVLQPSETQELEKKLSGLKMESQLQAYADEVNVRIDRRLNATQKAYIQSGGTSQLGRQKQQFGFQR